MAVFATCQLNSQIFFLHQKVNFAVGGYLNVSYDWLQQPQPLCFLFPLMGLGMWPSSSKRNGRVGKIFSLSSLFSCITSDPSHEGVVLK
jgi:hypothetical protein